MEENEIRQNGIDYFGLSVDFLDDIKVRKIVRVCGAKSIAVLVRLLANCYRFEGYWTEWSEDVAFFIAEEFGVKREFVQDVVQQALNVGFFDTNIFTQRSILTSKGIQSRFFEATARRKAVYYDATLMSAGVIIPKNAVSVDIFRPNVDISQQSKVKESKVKNNKNSSNSYSSTRSDFEQVLCAWNSLNISNITAINGGTRRSQSLSARIKEYGLESVLRAIKSIENSRFLKGFATDFKVTFDWFLKPNNFIKVLEGNYLDNNPREEKDIYADDKDIFDYAKEMGVI